MPISVRTGVRQNSTSTPDAIPDMNPQVWPSWAVGYIEACQSRPWRQSFDLEWLVAVWVSVGRDGAPDLGVGRGGVPPQRPGEAERKPKARARRSQPLEVRRGGACGLGVG